VQQAEKLNIQEPKLSRKRKVPSHYEIGSTRATDSAITPQDHYRVIYFEAFDTVIARITDRFEQEGYQMYSKLEKLLIKKQDEDLNEVFEFYGNDFEKDTLLAQLDSFHANYSFDQNATVHDIIPVVKGLSCGEKVLHAQVIKLVRMILVLPATNAVSERSFSAMRRTKNYLRTSMTQQRFNSVMTLHINKHYTDKLDLKAIGNEFRDMKDYRKSKFPVF